MKLSDESASGYKTGGPGGNSGSREPSARSGAPQAHARRSEFLRAGNVDRERERDFSHQTLDLNRSRSDDGRSSYEPIIGKNAIGRYGGLAGESERRSLERLERNVRIGHPVPGRELLEAIRTDVGDEIDLRVAGSLVQSDAERITLLRVIIRRVIDPDHARIVNTSQNNSFEASVALSNCKTHRFFQKHPRQRCPALGGPPKPMSAYPQRLRPKVIRPFARKHLRPAFRIRESYPHFARMNTRPRRRRIRYTMSFSENFITTYTFAIHSRVFRTARRKSVGPRPNDSAGAATRSRFRKRYRPYRHRSTHRNRPTRRNKPQIG